MFKSFSASIRSLWQSKSSDTATTSARKRKRSSDESDPDDPDVQILSVKKPRKEDTNSNSGILSFLRVPMSKMSNWVRKKTTVQDHVFVQPVRRQKTATLAQQGRQGGGEPGGLRDAALASSRSAHSLTTSNGPFSHTQNASRLGRLPLHSQNGSHENGVNGDVHLGVAQPGPFSISSSSSRRSSCSSSIRPGLGRRSTVEQCFQLKEKEDYRKLLQKYTTVDLGYGSTPPPPQPTLPHTPRQQGRLRPSLSEPSLFLSPMLATDSLSSKPQGLPPSTRFRVRPSTVGHSPAQPSDRVAAQHRVTDHLTPEDRGSGKGSRGVKREGGLLQNSRTSRRLSINTPGRRSLLSSSSQENSSCGDEGKQETSCPKPVSAEEEVIILEDSNGSTSGKPNFMSSVYLEEDWLDKLNSRYAATEKERRRLIKEAEAKKKILEERREEILGTLDKRLRKQMKLFDEEVEVIVDLPLPEVEEEQETALPELTPAMEREIAGALAAGPPGQVLSEGFRLQLTRADFATLRGLNWLNDEVINFYMNMLMERGEQSGGCKTYAFNTFFYPKVISGGHDAVRRWTRKVDIFSHQYLVIPVHLGVHWCLCVVFMKEKCIRYYDSMGGNNNQCLNAVRQYLHDESLQKRNVKLDLSQWSTETVKDIPQQMNGSDCGMFSCMYAETLTRGAKITFTQTDMPYFRRKMVYELLKKKLL